MPSVLQFALSLPNHRKNFLLDFFQVIFLGVFKMAGSPAVAREVCHGLLSVARTGGGGWLGLV